MSREAGILASLNVSLPVIAAPLAGGASAPALVIATGEAGAIGFLAGGYQSPAGLADQIAQVRAAQVPFGVNLFAPNPVPVDRAAFRRYSRSIQSEADRYGLELAGGEPVEDDDGWEDKLGLLLADSVPVVSFTFGIPDRAVVAALRKRGSLVVQTVTSPNEARAALDTGVDALVVQAASAGGHSATLTPGRPVPAVPLGELIGRVRSTTDQPLFAAGGIATPKDAAAALRAGAAAVVLGTALLLADESGTAAVHRAALTAPTARESVVTRAFTGRPARGLRNEFIDRHESDAPLGYPALHHLTSPLRKAAAAAGDPDRFHLWAGTGYRHARPGAAASIITDLAAEL